MTGGKKSQNRIECTKNIVRELWIWLMIVYWGLNLALYNRKKEKIPAVFPITVPPFWSNSSKDANVILPQEGWPVATALLLSKLRSIVVIIFSIIFQEEFQVLTFVSPLRSMLYIYDYEGRTWKNTFFLHNQGWSQNTLTRKQRVNLPKKCLLY